MSMIRVFGGRGEALEGISFASSLREVAPNEALFSQAIRVLRQNWRQGTVGCKTRGELAFSNKKPWRQKGTGRARVSSIRSPLWRKGGVIFGPQLRTRTLTLDKEQKRIVLRDLFAKALAEGRVACLDFAPEAGKPSTKAASSVLRSAGLHDGRVVLFASVCDFDTHASFGNIQNVSIASFDAANAFVFAYAKQWVFLKKDIELFKQMVGQWS